MDDLEMLERAQVFHDNYVIDEALFTAAFTKFGLTYAADFQTAIDEGLDFPTSADEDAQIAIVTEQIEAKMEECRDALQKLFNYSDNILNSPRTTMSLGKNRYEKARNSQMRMIKLLDTAHDIASETSMQAALVAGGCPVSVITDLDTLMGELWALNKSQESKMNLRHSKTQDRINIYNAVWVYMYEINGASKVVFADNPAKLTEYLLYPTSHPSLPKPQNPTAIVDGGDPTHAIVSCDAVQGATLYKLYYSEVTIGNPSGSFTFVLENAAPSFDYQMTVGKRTYWKIRAFSDSSSSDYSNEVWLDA